jgi:hypothetical protein
MRNLQSRQFIRCDDRCLHKFGSTLQEATDPAVSKAYAKIFLNKIEELHLCLIIVSEDFFVYYQAELGFLFIGEGERTIWSSQYVCRSYPDCMNPGTDQFK